MNRILSLLYISCVVGAASLNVGAQDKAAGITPYETLSDKAQQFYDRSQWPSASAMYSLMLDQRPTVVSTYGKAIVVAGMRDANLEQMQLFDMALKYHVPFDSLFSAVATESYSLGQTNMYENFLLAVQKSHPWLNRTIDSYLLSYYDYRCYPYKIIEYSEKMLSGMPDNEKFMYLLAHGYMLNSDYSQAINTYQQILDKNPQAYKALLYLGNIYMYLTQQGDEQWRAPAIEYLTRAKSIHDTPFVASSIAKLSE